ncbi:Transmembrane protein [Quillaja saponaria]|uniref:Transmembrane protein n=1 Tax=Quillaja saponaria TaxID=32244 RepID=A0AAD7LI85_QUISA|nr:Transmembrane protein [Quillaja saponaria]
MHQKMIMANLNMTLMTVTVISAIAMASLSMPSSSIAPMQAPPTSQIQIMEELYQLRLQIVEDYGSWDPAPYVGGGQAAPVPHGEDKLI